MEKKFVSANRSLSLVKIARAAYNTSRLGHKALVLWAADCAEHVLHYFEVKFPNDNRPRRAIEVGRAWVNDGGLSITKAAYAAHAAAREASAPNTTATYAARAAGQAVSTAHTGGHAVGAAAYAIKASADPAAELEWQRQRLQYYETEARR
jgi:hypothetical protein